MNRLSEEIARVAYELYEKRGKGHGGHFDDWLEAEKIVMTRHAKSAETTRKSTGTVKKRTSTRASKEKTGEKANATRKPAVRKKRSAPSRTS